MTAVRVEGVLVTAEARAEAIHAAHERLSELLPAPVVVEVGEHRVSSMSVTARSHAARTSRPRSLSATSTTLPWLAAGERTISPSVSSAASTSFIDCGVTYVRRASCALDSPGRSRRIDSAVYFGHRQPGGRDERIDLTA